MWLAVVQGRTTQGEPAPIGISGCGQCRLALMVRCFIYCTCSFFPGAQLSGATCPWTPEQLPLAIVLKHPVKLSYFRPEAIEDYFLPYL